MPTLFKTRRKMVTATRVTVEELARMVHDRLHGNAFALVPLLIGPLCSGKSMFCAIVLPPELCDNYNSRMDMLVQPPDYIYIFELKNNQSAVAALQQIESKGDGPAFRCQLAPALQN